MLAAFSMGGCEPPNTCPWCGGFIPACPCGATRNVSPPLVGMMLLRPLVWRVHDPTSSRRGEVVDVDHKRGIRVAWTGWIYEGKTLSADEYKHALGMKKLQRVSSLSIATLQGSRRSSRRR